VSIHFPKIPSSLSPNSDSISSKSTPACHQLLGFCHGDSQTFFIRDCSPHPSAELRGNTMSLQIYYREDLFYKAKFHVAQNLAPCMGLQLTVASAGPPNSRDISAVHRTSAGTTFISHSAFFRRKFV